MSSNEAIYSEFWQLLGWFLLIAGLVHALRRENWHTLSNPHRNSWLAACVVILLLWQLRAQIQQGITFHILGSAALTLIAGPYRAMLGMAAIVLLQAIFGHIAWVDIGILWGLKAAIPITVCTLLLRWAQHRLPHNYFIYIFLNCFGAAALSMWLFGFFHCLTLTSSALYSWEFLYSEILPYYFLMGWPEGFTTGLNLTLMVVWQPHWVATFDDRKYLQRRD
ncbi:energy-coupling factor ABC transporter permease [Chitinibacter sp. S2-10]|uniref:energy-coupling factor ABC transporter permease n=1 Tax=Chitinibacter sp. S2-10 TaxID=3373597 RepID=UPI0039778A85